MSAGDKRGQDVCPVPGAAHFTPPAAVVKARRPEVQPQMRNLWLCARGMNANNVWHVQRQAKVCNIVAPRQRFATLLRLRTPRPPHMASTARYHGGLAGVTGETTHTGWSPLAAQRRILPRPTPGVVPQGHTPQRRAPQCRERGGGARWAGTRPPQELLSKHRGLVGRWVEWHGRTGTECS